MEIFAERLKELRTEKGLSIQQLSQEVKIGVASICRWENCQADVKGSQLVTLAKYFGVTIDYLMGLENAELKLRFYKLFGPKWVE